MTMPPLGRRVARSNRSGPLFSAALVIGLFYHLPVCSALEQVTFARDGATVHINGKILTEAVDGGLILQDRQGKLWLLQAAEIKSRKADAIPYEPMDRQELGRTLLDIFFWTLRPPQLLRRLSIYMPRLPACWPRQTGLTPKEQTLPKSSGRTFH